MIDPSYVRVMARYNEWQNRSLYQAAETLTDEERRRDVGAFFGCLHDTLHHILWADGIWLARFTGEPRPGGGFRGAEAVHGEWRDLAAARSAFDQRILAWSDRVEQAWLDSDMTWIAGFSGQEMTRPVALLVTHFFNHQTHHRGQAHAILTRFGAKPDATDLMVLAARFPDLGG